MYECLFEENYIGTMKLKNRLIVPAMSTRFVGEDGKATEQFTAYHEARAKGGWALLITEDFLIDEGVGVKKELPGLWNGDQIQGYKQCTDRIHGAGGRICAQIYHAGRNTHSGITGIHNVGPSPICDPSNREVPHELTVDEIRAIEEKFAGAALRARLAGFDAVELHGAHGYLIAQFLSPFSNRRADEYGGTLENRARFAVETVKAVKEKAGRDYPVIFRISATEFMNQGMNVEQAKAICRLLEAAGVDAINCSQSGPATFYNTVPSFYVPNGAFVELADGIRRVVKIPVATVGRINSPQLAEEIILSGKADLVAMGRASVADPDLPKKLQAGNTQSILTCIGCCQGCLGSTLKKKTLTCLVNPFAGKETTHSPEDRAEAAKRILVVGGGISGCEAAVITAMRGHRVTLVERGERLGGQWNAASVPRCKADFSSFVSWQKHMLRQLGVTVILGREADRELLVDAAPDLVLDATGSNPVRVPVPGLETAKTAFAQEILMGKKPFGAHPLIIGGGLAGAETAEFIAGYKVPVDLVEMREAIAMDCEPGPKYFLLKALGELGVSMYTMTTVKRVEGTDVVAEKGGKEICIHGIDQIILAVGMRSNGDFKEMLADTGIKVIPIGDAASVKNGFSNVQEAFLTASEI